MRRAVVSSLEFKWRILAISMAVVVAISIATFGYLSHEEDPIQGMDPPQMAIRRIDPITGTDELSFPKRVYRVAIESIDESAGIIRLKVDLRVPSQDALVGAYMRFSGLTSYTSKSQIPLSFGSLKISDLTLYVLSGMSGPPSAVKSVRDLSSPLSESPPSPVESDVIMLGDPWRYPFDGYFVAAGVNCDVTLKDANQERHPLEDFGYHLRDQVPPNLIIKRATREDVEWAVRRFTNASFEASRVAAAFDPDGWRHGVVVLIMHRPIFPRFFAVFFGVVAVIWIGFIVMIEDKKQLMLNVVGYFLSIWAIRAPLATGAPKVTTLMDYATLGLYAILIAAVGFRLLWGYQKPALHKN